MHVAIKKFSPWEKIIGTILEMVGVFVVAFGFLDLYNSLLEFTLIIIGFSIVITGLNLRTK